MLVLQQQVQPPTSYNFQTSAGEVNKVNVNNKFTQNIGIGANIDMGKLVTRQIIVLIYQHLTVTIWNGQLSTRSINGQRRSVVLDLPKMLKEFENVCDRRSPVIG